MVLWKDCCSDVFRREVSIWPDAGFQRGYRRVDESHSFHSVVALLGGFVPTFAEAVFAFVDVFPQGVEREVGCGEVEVKEEGVAWVVADVAFEKLNDVVADGGGAIEAAGEFAGWEVFSI